MKGTMARWRQTALAGVAAAMLATAWSAAAFDAFEAAERPYPAPEARFLTADGTATTLASFRGRVVLLNLWATWCAPCRAELPALDDVQATLGGNRFIVVAVSVDTGSGAAVDRFFGEGRIGHLEAFRDPEVRLPRALGVGAYPASLLIGPHGVVLGRFRAAVDWRTAEARTFLTAAIDQAFAEEAPRP